MHGGKPLEQNGIRPLDEGEELEDLEEEEPPEELPEEVLPEELPEEMQFGGGSLTQISPLRVQQPGVFTSLKVKHLGVVALLSMWDTSLQRGVPLFEHTTVCPLQDIEEPDDELLEEEEVAQTIGC